MSSTLNSEKEKLIEAFNLHMVFKTHFHHQNFRDLFVEILSSPFEFLTSKEESLYILKGVDFSIFKGDIVGILGVNGSGKTTLCRLLSKTYTPTRGKVLTYGEVKAIFDTQIGINDELTGKENAYLLASLMYPNVKNQKQLVREALDFSELGEFEDMPFKKYSKGMQARLFLSLISSLPSDILILDEVFDGADLFFKEKVSKRVLKMIEKSGAVVFISHSPDQILSVCNRVLVLHEGKIAYDGDAFGGVQFFKKLGRSPSSPLERP